MIPSVSTDSRRLRGEFTIVDAEFRRFASFVSRQTGILLHEGKQQLVAARLRKRLAHYGYRRLGQYHRHLLEHDPRGEELVRMVNALTTNKTDFFREAHHFAFLGSEVLGRRSGRAPDGRARRLRIWSAGCSSGEEAYSIAVTVLDAWPNAVDEDVRILGSDIDTGMLAYADTGIYPAERLVTVPVSLRDRFFVAGRGRDDGLYRVRPAIRQLVTFRRINLRDESWPVRALFDAIFCRNVLIYFDRALQQRIVARLSDYLAPEGYLFLGHSESLLGTRPELRYLGHTVFQKAGGGARR